MRRDGARLEGVHQLDEARKPRGNAGIADIGGHRADRQRLCAALVDRAERADFGSIAIRRADTVCLDIVDVARLDARQRVDAACRQLRQAAVARSFGDRGTAGNADAAQQRQHRQAAGARILFAHQNAGGSPLARPEAVGPCIEDAHAPAAEATGARQADQFGRIEREIDGGDDGRIERAGNKPVHGIAEGGERGGGSGIDREGATRQIEMAGDPAGDGAGADLLDLRSRKGWKAVAQCRLETLAKAECLCVGYAAVRDRAAQQAVQQRLPGAQRGLSGEPVGSGGDDDAGAPAAQPVATAKGRNGIGRHIEGQPVARIGLAKDSRRNAEPFGIEMPVGQEARLDRGDRIQRADAVLMPQIERQTARRHGAKGAATMHQVAPENLRRRRIRQTAGNGTDRNRSRHQCSLKHRSALNAATCPRTQPSPLHKPAGSAAPKVLRQRWKRIAK